MDQVVVNEKGMETNYVHQSYTELNPLTGLYYNRAFFQRVHEFLKDVESGSYCMVAIDLEHFRLFNKMYGREQGDELLIQIAECLKEFRRENTGVVGYTGGDNFGVVMPYDQELIRQLTKTVTQEVAKWNNTLGFRPVFGVYVIEDTEIPAATMYDRASIALSNVVGNYSSRICEYDAGMEATVEEEVRLLAEIQTGLEKEEFIFYVQPQCDISTGKIVGGESLVRWKHGDKGLISPGVFVPVLERNGFIADLDKYVWKKVCQWLRECIDKGYQPVPISINVSRIDIFSMDVLSYLTELLHDYDLSAKLLKVEITESAYAESNDKIIRTVKQLRDADFVVMMDDFGSGYSSLNMLKSVSVDVLKLDMRFLDMEEQEEEKGIDILESVVGMARQMRLPVVAEGVETQKQERFLLAMGCHYTQGYYYYKPMPVEEFEKLIVDEQNIDLNGFWCRQTEDLHVREIFDDNVFNDVILNNILGAAAYYEMHANQIEIIRVNQQYQSLAGVEPEVDTYYKKFWNHVRDDDRAIMFSVFEKAYACPNEGAQGDIHFVRANGETLLVHIRVFFLREKAGHRFFFGILNDVTKYRRQISKGVIWNDSDGKLTEEQRQNIERFSGNLPWGYCVVRVDQNEMKIPMDYEVIYINNVAQSVGSGSVDTFRSFMEKIFMENNENFLEKAHRAAYYGETTEVSFYNSMVGKYIKMTIYPYEYGYVGCMAQDITNYYISENIIGHIMRSYREVYYLHLWDNYYRMIYPEDDLLLERGNYEAAINRHFGTGKILSFDEENIRKFLSLKNLKSALLKQDTVEYKYRRSVKDVGEEWCLTTITVCERQDGIPKTAVMTIRSIESLMHEREEKGIASQHR